MMATNHFGKYSIIHQNAQSIGNCIDELQLLLEKNENCAALCITEHWKKSEQLLSYNLVNFELISSYCRPEGYGGAAIYGKIGLNWTPLKYIEAMSVPTICECAGAELILTGTKIVILACYRAPNTQIDAFLNILESILTKIANDKCMIFLTGDFNINLSIQDLNSNNLLSLLNSFDLYPTILEATRITTHCRSCIDNIHTNCNEYTSEVLHTQISDHTAQLVQFNNKSL